MPSQESTAEYLRQLKDELMHRVVAIDADIHHRKEPVEKDFAEQVTQRENDEVLTAIDEETQQTINLIDAALQRIEEGNYGTCINCGVKIPEDRLSALPYVTTCIDCAA